MDDEHLYRRGVGVMLLNRERKVWVGRRIDNPGDAWQMPQGGMDEGEEPGKVELIGECPERLRYDLPAELAGKFWGGKWRGQLQNWFLCRFLGDDRDVNISTAHAEFDAWKWVDPQSLPDLIVPFKRELYRKLLRDFAPHL
jgi:putative (di)nucleoside polyphosphate hydrolase